MERLTERLENGAINVKYASQHETAIHRLVTIEDILGDEYDLDELSKAMAALRREHQKDHNATWYDIGASGAHCSRCHYRAPQQSRYCPHCGAKMGRREKP